MRSFCLFLLGLFIFLSSTAKAETAAYDRVLKTGVLRCAYTVNAVHVGKNLKTGKLEGLIVDIAEEMAAAVGLKVEWVAEVGHADFAEGFKGGRYDAYCGILAMAPARARVAAFTTPLFYSPYYPYVRVDENRFKTVDDLNNSAIKAGTVDGEVFQKMTRNLLPETQEVSLPNMTPSGQLFVDLADKKVDVVIHDPILFMSYEKNNPGKIRRAFGADKPLQYYPVGFALSPHETELRDMLNVALTGLHNLGRIDALLKKHGVDEATAYRIAVPYKNP